MGQPMGRLPQPAFAAMPMMPMMPVMQHAQPPQPDRAGDWQCPNASCLNHHKMVFGKNASCPKCGSPKPAGNAAMQEALGALMQGLGMNMGGGSLGGMNLGGAVPQAQPERPGDWQCPNGSCLNHHKMVFGKNASCPKCGTPKPARGAPSLGGALGALIQGLNMNVHGMHAGGGAPPPTRSRGGSNPGDWRCPNPECMNSRSLVFAKHQSCPKCGSEKPFMDGAEMGYGSGAMDRSRSPHRTQQMMTGGEGAWNF